MLRRHRFLSVGEIGRLADVAAGEPLSVRDVGALVSAADRPALDLDGVLIHPDPYAQAAALLHALVSTRPFDTPHHGAVGLFVALAALDRNDVRTGTVDVEDCLRLTREISGGLDDTRVIALHLRQIVEGRPWSDPLP